MKVLIKQTKIEYARHLKKLRQRIECLNDDEDDYDILAAMVYLFVNQKVFGPAAEKFYRNHQDDFIRSPPIRDEELKYIVQERACALTSEFPGRLTLCKKSEMPLWVSQTRVRERVDQ